MSAKAAIPVKRSRWLDWNPKTHISADSAGSEPTKPTKPGFVGFVGAPSEERAEIEGTASRGAVHSDRVPSRVRIFEDSPEEEAKKPSKPSSVGFVGATSAESHEIGAGASVGGDSPSQPNGSRISGNSHETEPTEPSKPGSVGFVGATPAEDVEIHADADPVELARASAVLNRAGVRIMQIDGVTTIGIWSDLDGPEIRKALRTFGSGQLPVRYLDGAGVPTRYKLRRVAGEPVPMAVLSEMERHPNEPWKVRDRMLREMGWGSQATSWAEWKAAALNRLFQEQGVTGRPGRITAATALHGERKRQRRGSILAASARYEPTKPAKPPLERG